MMSFHLSKPWLSFALLTVGLPSVCGQEVPPHFLADRVVRSQSLATDFRGTLWNDPALRYDYLPHPFTTVALTGSVHDFGRAHLQQTGSRDTQLGVDVHSFLILPQDQRVFGSASYRNERQDGVQWNENLDWELLAPYVTGDSIGGFLKGETYQLGGGYAVRRGRWTFGGEASYRAAHNYRDRDPRSQNTVSDLSGTLAASYRWTTYRLALSAQLRWYQQHSDIDFRSDQGSTSVYHLSGLGLDYVRFAGNQTATQHRGIQVGGRLSLLPTHSESGLSATVHGRHFAIEKQLNQANNLPLQTLYKTEVGGNITALKSPTAGRQEGLRLEVDYEARRGWEHIYGEAGGPTYGNRIGRQAGLQTDRWQAQLTGLWEVLPTGRRRWGGALLPQVAYRRWTADYALPARSLQMDAAEMRCTARWQYRPRRWHWTSEVTGAYHRNLSHRFDTGPSDPSVPSIRRSMEQALHANLRYLSDSFATVGFRLQGGYPVHTTAFVTVTLEGQLARYETCGTARRAAWVVSLHF